MRMVACTNKNAVAKGDGVLVIDKAGALCRNQDRQVERDLCDGLIQRCAGFGFAATAAIGTGGACLQLSEAAHTVGRGAADVVIGDGVAKANVHARISTRMRMIVN